MQDLRGRAYSDDEILDISLTIILLSPARRRALLSAEDPAVWVADYWKRTDPSPDTPENEALEVFRQRAKYLQARFPDTFLNEIP